MSRDELLGNQGSVKSPSCGHTSTALQYVSVSLKPPASPPYAEGQGASYAPVVDPRCHCGTGGGVDAQARTAACRTCCGAWRRRHCCCRAPPHLPVVRGRVAAILLEQRGYERRVDGHKIRAPDGRVARVGRVQRRVHAQLRGEARRQESDTGGGAHGAAAAGGGGKAGARVSSSCCVRWACSLLSGVVPCSSRASMRCAPAPVPVRRKRARRHEALYGRRLRAGRRIQRANVTPPTW